MEKLIERMLKEIKMNQDSSDFYRFEMNDDLKAEESGRRAGLLIYCLMAIYSFDEIQEMLHKIKH